MSAQKTDNSDNIFDNAIAAIELGVEDYNASQSNPRRVHSAVRNIFAGILLLFKSKLSELSENDDEALLKQEVLPKSVNGKLSWFGNGKKTVDVPQIRKRFESLAIAVDWTQLDKLQEYRNNIEHYFDKSNTKHDVVRSYVANSFIIIHRFIAEQFSRDPIDYFSAEIWKTFITESGIHEAELQARNRELGNLFWFHEETLRIFKKFTCRECGSEIISVAGTFSESNDAKSAEFYCRNCDQHFSYEEIIKSQLNSEASVAIYIDGADPIGYCPRCGEETYDSRIDICHLCGEEGPYLCIRCGMEILPEELLTYEDTEMCGWCAHMWERAMEDD